MATRFAGSPVRVTFRPACGRDDDLRPAIADGHSAAKARTPSVASVSCDLRSRTRCSVQPRLPLTQLEISDVHLMHVTATPTKHAAGDSFTAASATPAMEVEVRACVPLACTALQSAL
jgi:hypothetical protein